MLYWWVRLIGKFRWYAQESVRVKILPISLSPFLTAINYKGHPKFKSCLCFTPKVNPRFLTPSLCCIKRGSCFIPSLCSSLCHFFWTLGYKPKLLFIVSRIWWILCLIAGYSGKKIPSASIWGHFPFFCSSSDLKASCLQNHGVRQIGMFEKECSDRIAWKFWFLPISSLCPSCSLLANYHLCRQSTWLDLLGN